MPKFFIIINRIFIPGSTQGVGTLLSVNVAGMFPITAVGVDTLNVEGTWRFAKDMGNIHHLSKS